jgi:hypothetical protein
MPFEPTINIHTEDLKKIVDALEQSRIGQALIKIVDDGSRYVIRDSGGFVITHVAKGNLVHDRGG